DLPGCFCNLLSVCLSEIGWKVKANDRAYHQLPEFQKKVFLCIKKRSCSVESDPGYHGNHGCSPSFSDHSRNFHPSLVHHPDSAGHRAGNHRHQRPGGRSGRTPFWLKGKELSGISARWSVSFFCSRPDTGWTRR
uniref:Uncharacterized protein n=1 Tax=Cyprinodon variegatus TaxID=28743 RepID=A0A3Q2EBT0_CYPVA